MSYLEQQLRDLVEAAHRVVHALVQLDRLPPRTTNQHTPQQVTSVSASRQQRHTMRAAVGPISDTCQSHGIADHQYAVGWGEEGAAPHL